MKDMLNQKVMPVLMGFVNTKAIQCLKDGLLYSMPMMIIGSVFLLLANFPYIPAAEWLKKTGITAVLNQTYGCTFNVMALLHQSGLPIPMLRMKGIRDCLPV